MLLRTSALDCTVCENHFLSVLLFIASEFCFNWLCNEVNHFYWPTNALNCIKLNRLKSTWINILKELKTPTRFGSFGIHPQGVLKLASLKLLEMFCVRSSCLAAWNLDLWCVCLQAELFFRKWTFLASACLNVEVAALHSWFFRVMSDVNWCFIELKWYFFYGLCVSCPYVYEADNLFMYWKHKDCVMYWY